MRSARWHKEQHHGDRIGWLRAAVLRANDGIVSTASLILGVAAANADHRTILLTGVSGLVAGAMSMAAGEFVSVHSQQDTEEADLAREREELQANPDGEQRELTAIFASLVFLVGPGRGLRTSRRRKRVAWGSAGHLLGCHGDGGHCRGRGLVRRRGWLTLPCTRERRQQRHRPVSSRH